MRAARRDLLARARRTADRRAAGRARRDRSHARLRGTGHGPDRPRSRAAVAGRQQRARLHQHRAGARTGGQPRPAATARITGQGNGQGGREHGQKADQLPGYRQIDDPAARRHMAAVWDVPEASIPGPGKSAFELLDTLGRDDGVRALLVIGSNVLVSAPDAERINKRLESLDLLVVSDFFLSETAALADVVLPGAQWAEEDGTTTNLEGRVSAAPPCARSSAERAHRPGDARGPGGPAGPRALVPVPPRRARCSRSCAGRAQAASPTTPASPTTGSTRRTACSGRVPASLIQVRRGCSWTASRRPAAARVFTPSRTSRRRKIATATIRSTSPPGGCSRTISPAPRRGASPRCRRSRRSRSRSCIR